MEASFCLSHGPSEHPSTETTRNGNEEFMCQILDREEPFTATLSILEQL